MKFKRIFFAVLAFAGIAVSCQDQLDKGPVEPVKVEKLVSPRNNLSVYFKNLETLTFEWEATVWKGDGQPTFELVFDRVGGDFSNPVHKIATDANVVDLTLEEARKIFAALAGSGDTATAEWGVYAYSGNNKTFSASTRTVTFDNGKEPALVKSLYRPADNSVFNTYDMDATVKFTWSEAEWEGTDEVAYEVVFALEDAVEPVKTLPAQTNSLDVTREQLSEVFNAATVDGADARLIWYVNAVADGKTTGSVTSNHIVLQYIEGRKFKVGETLYIGGEGAEEGQAFTFVDDAYYKTTPYSGDNFAIDKPYYEIHTQLEAGKNYYFYGLGDDEKLYVTADDFEPVREESEARATVAESGVYRIRINTVTNEVTMLKIERFYYYLLNQRYEADLSYRGKGVWAIDDYYCEVDKDGEWCDDRYKFIMTFAGTDKIQHYGANHNDDERHDNHETAPEGYFDIQMTATSDWDGKFKVPGHYHRKYATVTVYLNNDKGHYTHEYTNVTADAPAAFEIGDPLYIGGAGAEAGQQFTFVDADYYDTSLKTYEDNFAVDMPYYEIHTKLLAGQDYYFYAVDGDEEVFVSAKDFTTTADAASASTKVDESGLYRVRVNTATGEITTLKIERFYFLHLQMKYQVDFEYAGKGVWSQNFKFEVDENGQWRDDRYKFIMTFAGTDKIQHYGANHNDDKRHDNHETAPEGYFDIQMTATSDWDGKFKVPGHYHRKYGTMTVYLNEDKGHYTHEYTNVTAEAPTVEFAVGDPLYIGGLGSEAGQQFTFVDADYYDTTLKTYEDNFAVAMPYYEIHTKLEAGLDYYFYGMSGNAKAYKSATDFTQQATASAASTTVDETGLYRVRVNTATGEITTLKIERFYFLHLWMKYQVDFEYAGKGVWSQNFKFEVDENGQWRDDRYKFIMTFAGTDKIQHYGANHNDDKRHDNHETAPEGYFDIQMTATSDWDGKFKVPGHYHRKTGTMTVYLNEDKGHYTHEYTNIQ